MDGLFNSNANQFFIYLCIIANPFVAGGGMGPLVGK
jgi:hypothetical protein